MTPFRKITCRDCKLTVTVRNTPQNAAKKYCRVCSDRRRDAKTRDCFARFIDREGA